MKVVSKVASISDKRLRRLKNVLTEIGRKINYTYCIVFSFFFPTVYVKCYNHLYNAYNVHTYISTTTCRSFIDVMAWQISLWKLCSLVKKNYNCVIRQLWPKLCYPIILLYWQPKLFYISTYNIFSSFLLPLCMLEWIYNKYMIIGLAMSYDATGL